MFSSEASHSKFETKEETALPAGNRDSTGDFQTSVQTNPPTQRPTDHASDNAIFLPGALTGKPSKVFDGLKVEPLHAGIYEPDEPANDDEDDGGWVPEYGAPASGRLNGGQAPTQDELVEDDDTHFAPVQGDIAPPLAPDEGDDGGQVLAHGCACGGRRNSRAARR